MLLADQTSQATEFGIQVATSTHTTTTTARPKRELTSKEKSMMIEAAKIGNITVFNAIFDDGIIDPNAVIDDTSGGAALHYAAVFGNLEIFQLYDRKGGDLMPIFMPKRKSLDKLRGYSPLHYAARAGHLDIVEFLTARIENKNPSDDNGMTPLHLAATNGHLSIVQLLVGFLENKNPKAGIRWKEITPLHAAALGGHLDVLQFLLQFNEQGTNPPISDGRTCLHLAAQNGHLNIIKHYKEELNY